MKSFSVTSLIALLAARVVARAAKPPCTGVTPLRVEAQHKDILLGSGAINPAYLDDGQFSDVLAREFNSLSPENELKWAFIHPTKDQYNWHLIDRLVDFGEEHGLAVKGHGLITRCCNPDYLLNITDPVAFRREMEVHIDTVIRHYKGKVDRWDVVVEVLETMGGGLDKNDFYKVLGPSYIEDAFHFARAADPDAKLFFNENLVESIPSKRQELYEYLAEMLAKGVPIDGIALQMHITQEPLVPGVVKEMFELYGGLGLEVTIAEMDVHTLNDTLQTQIYGDTVAEALEAGITDISFWGFTDKHLYTWLPGAKPLMFDEEYRPKGSFYATHTALSEFVNEN